MHGIYLTCDKEEGFDNDIETGSSGTENEAMEFLSLTDSLQFLMKNYFSISKVQNAECILYMMNLSIC